MIQYFKKLLAAVGDITKAFWLFLPATLTIALIYYMLMALDLAVDTLMITGESGWKLSLLVLVTIFWAVVVWFSSRIVSLVPPKQEDGTITTNHKTNFTNPYFGHLPRYLAANCFVAIQCAVLSLKHVMDMSGFVIVLFIIAHALYYLLLTNAYNYVTVKKLKDNNSGIGAIIIGILYSGFLITVAVYNRINTPDIVHSYRLPFISVVLFGLQILALWVYIFRKKKINTSKVLGGNITLIDDGITAENISKNQILNFHYKLLLKFGIHPNNAIDEVKSYVIFHIFCIIGFALYIATILSIGIASFFGPLIFSLLALGIIVIFFNLLAAISRKVNYSIAFLLFTVIFVISMFGTRYQARTIQRTTTADMCMSTDTFLRRWYTDTIRKTQIDAATRQKPYVAYIILNDGGGSRAATWSAMLLSKLNDDTESRFGQHIFAIAGASGGSIGNTAFYGLLKNDNIVKGTYLAKASSFFKRDFLSHTLGRFFGPDFLKYLFPVSFMDDRAGALESTFEYQGKDTVISNFFASKADTSLNYSGRLPALFINTTDVKYGTTAIVGNVRLNDGFHENLFDRICPGNTFRMSTAAVLSARFPYVSPAGELNGRYYVDGGYFDNSGAGTMMSFMKEVERSIKASDLNAISDKIVFHIIEIHNGKKDEISAYSVSPLANDLLAPVQTLIGIQNASTRIGNYQLRAYMAEQGRGRDPNQALIFELYDPNIADEEEYPMSWINSEYQFGRIHARLNKVAERNTAYKKILANVSPSYFAPPVDSSALLEVIPTR